MDWTDLQARASSLAKFDGWTDSNPAPSWDVLTNQAWAKFSWDAELLNAVVTFSTVAGTVFYVLPTSSNGPFKVIQAVTYDQGATNVALVHSTEAFEGTLNPAWLNAAQAVPQRFVFSQFDTIGLSPPPSAVKTVQVRGIVGGQYMTAGTDSPGQVGGVGTAIPEDFHDAIAYKAVYLWGVGFAQGAAMDRLNEYEENYKSAVMQARGDVLSGFRRHDTGEQ